ncbi:MAG: sodium-dependent transporter [Hahellaceae bacterium]|nr:sodium-dependent transporter [Hahellaceae bacterium]
MIAARFSRIGFILAAAGSAVGLGNIWKFPYITGENGGGAFVLIYLMAITFIGLSIFIAEVAMGRLSRSDAVSAYESLAPKPGPWKFAGFTLLTGILILTYYPIVIGWVFKYIWVAATHLPTTVEASGAAFGEMLTQDASGQIFYFTLAFLCTFLIVSMGVKKGIEKLNLVLMPLLVIILLLLFCYAITLDGFDDALKFLFVADFSKVRATSVMEAVGHAFFTLSLGMCCIMTYSASLPENANIVRSSFTVAVLDTAIALVAGIIIFSLIFSFNAEPGQGPGLLFISLPPLFAQLGMAGTLGATLFFVAVAFAGVTSCISIVEPGVLYLTNRLNWSRPLALLAIGGVAYSLGLLALLSNIEHTGDSLKLFGMGAFDLFDFTSSSILLPLGGILVAVFVGYVMEKQKLEHLLLPYMHPRLFHCWYFSIRYLAPAGVVAMMINKLAA